MSFCSAHALNDVCEARIEEWRIDRGFNGCLPQVIAAGGSGIGRPFSVRLCCLDGMTPAPKEY